MSHRLSVAVPLVALALLSGCASSVPDAERGQRVVVRGDLTPEDERGAYGEAVDRIATLTWAPGETLRVWMESEVFDTVLRVDVAGERGGYENDDDATMDSDAAYASYIDETNTTRERLDIEILAMAYDEGEYGPYLLWYQILPRGAGSPAPPAPPAPPGPEPLAHTSDHVGRIGPGTPGPDGSVDFHADVYTITLREDEGVHVRVTSDDFEPRLRVLRSGGAPIDGSGPITAEGWTDVSLIEPGAYTLHVGTRPDGGEGAYAITVLPTEADVFLTERFVPNGRMFQGELDALDDFVVITPEGVQREADTHDIVLRAGQELSLQLQSSDFDTYLVVKRGDEILASNDDFRGMTHTSVIGDFVAPTTGTYTVVVASYDEGGRGRYFLSGRVD